MMASLFIKIDHEFREEQTECQLCTVCEEVIYSAAYRLCIHFGTKTEETDIVLCNSCKDAIQKQD